MADAPARFKDLCLDARDHQTLADWWCAALGYVRRDDARAAGGRRTASRSTGRCRSSTRPAPGPLMWIVPVPEPKIVKNRMHFDVIGDTPALLAAGATLVRPATPTRTDDAIEWDVLADPEGNEFCVFAPE